MAGQKHKTREGWLTDGMERLAKKFFKENGYELPKMRVSCGFPRGHATAIGQCWDKTSSKDKTYEMFICPTQDDPVEVLQILLHEMIHAGVGLKCGHKGAFRKLAKEFGMAGKMTSTYAEKGSELFLSLSAVAEKLGPYPHAPMQKKVRATKPSKWVRYKSMNEDTYRVVINGERAEEYGAPRDPWGDEMELTS